MAEQNKLDECYMGTAIAHAKLSKARRTKVGCALVTPQGVILGGVNGLAPGGDNFLEYMTNGELVTREEVIHAELNCILKAAREGVSVLDGTLYTTLSCCLRCSEMVAAAGIKRVVYMEEYRDTSGLDNLREKGIQVDKFGED